ncbi:hypothetical protein ANCCAN_06762 [Ancylostoma caninum]|uniref:Uncharacterized protein n=1 Tax=Ancylostoma caninum TaxID=29170 RepID=A0A368GW03_ANCCA|nr:hypothetical protein ANCCAN_06762 [Ancylostoma caninum]
MSKTRLKSLLSSALLIQVFLYAGERFHVPLYAPDVIEKMHAIQYYVQKLENQISIEKLEANPGLSTFLKGVSERARQFSKVPKPSMIIMAMEGSFPWIQNLACSVAGYDMLTRISVITIDHETTISLGLEFPMMPVCELGFDEFSVKAKDFSIPMGKKRKSSQEIVPPNLEKAVRRQLFDILRLRIGAMVAKKDMDVLIAAPNQVWTSYLLNRTMYLFRNHQDRESLLLQKLSAHIMTQKYTTADSALTYACDVPEGYMCRRISPERMSGTGWFNNKRKVAPDIVHLPMKTKISVLSKAGLWLLTDGGICMASLRENLMESLLHSNPKLREGLLEEMKPQQLRTRIRPPHPSGHRSFLEESGLADL